MKHQNQPHILLTTKSQIKLKPQTLVNNNNPSNNKIQELDYKDPQLNKLHSKYLKHFIYISLNQNLKTRILRGEK